MTERSDFHDDIREDNVVKAGKCVNAAVMLLATCPARAAFDDRFETDRRHALHG